MSSSSEALPRFGKPPVIETVLGIHFRPLEKFTSAHQGLLWDRCFRKQFPILEERPPVEEVRERFGEERLAPPMIRWQVSDRPDAPRLWAASENGQHAVQIQKNALFTNWLKTSEEVPYCPYEERRQEFDQQLDRLAKFFRDEGIGQLEPTTWSITYVNHIDYEGLHDVGPTIAKTIGVWANQRSDGWLPEPDKVVLDFAFPMPDNRGRLNVNLTPAALLSNKKQILRMDLTARGQLKVRDVASALAGIDLGHEWIVRGFASLTRPEMPPNLGEDTMSAQFTISENRIERTVPSGNLPMPDWFGEVETQLNAVAALPAGWDTYGAPQPKSEILNSALWLLACLCKAKRFVKPYVNPTPTEGVQFEWERGARYFEIELVAERAATYLFRDDEAGIEESGEVFEGDSLDAILVYLRRFAE